MKLILDRTVQRYVRVSSSNRTELMVDRIEPFDLEIHILFSIKVTSASILDQTSRNHSQPLWNSRHYGTDVRRRSTTNPRAILGSGYASAVRVSSPPLHLHRRVGRGENGRTYRLDWRTYLRHVGGTSCGARVRTCLRACTCVHVIRVARVPTCPALHGERSKTWAASSLAGAFEPSAQPIGTSHVHSSSRKSPHLKEAFLEREYVPCLDIRKLQLFVICENGNGTTLKRWRKGEGREDGGVNIESVREAWILINCRNSSRIEKYAWEMTNGNVKVQLSI